MTHFYETSYANVHRGVYELAERATAGYEGARRDRWTFSERTLLPRGGVHQKRDRGNQPRRLRLGMNNLGPGDVVLVTELEHHSNFVPLAVRGTPDGADFRMLPLDDQGELRRGAR